MMRYRVLTMIAGRFFSPVMPDDTQNQIRSAFCSPSYKLAALASAADPICAVGNEKAAAVSRWIWTRSREHAFLQTHPVRFDRPTRSVRSFELSVNLDDGTLNANRTNLPTMAGFWVQSEKMRDVQFSWTEFATGRNRIRISQPPMDQRCGAHHRINTLGRDTQTGSDPNPAADRTPRHAVGPPALGAVLVSLDFNRAWTLDMTRFWNREPDRNQTTSCRHGLRLASAKRIRCLLIEARPTPAPAFDLDTTCSTATPDPSLPPPSTLALFSINEDERELQAQSSISSREPSRQFQWASALDHDRGLGDCETA